MIDYSRARLIQEATRKKISLKDDLPGQIRLIGALDVSYKRANAYSAAVIYDVTARRVAECKIVRVEAKAPYVPGYFFLREINPLLVAYDLVDNKPDIVLINGHGYSHPRRAGIASYFGVLTSVPTIGVAKKLLVGDEICTDETSGACVVKSGGEILGMSIRTQVEKWYISPGHKISVQTSFMVVKEIVQSHQGSLYPMVLADLITKRCSGDEHR